MRILVAEDETTLSAQLCAALTEAGYAVDAALSGRDACYQGEIQAYDAVVLDLGLPELDGISVLKRWRSQGRNMPVLILTARDQWHEKVTGIDAGADDYIAKPFSTKELLARVRAVLRRRAPEQVGGTVAIAGLSLDASTYRVTFMDQMLKLGPTEFKLLHYFMNHAERVHSRSQLLDKVWGDHVFIEERTVDVHVKRLREALGTTAGQMIETVRGAGYRLTGQVTPVVRSQVNV